MGIIQILDHQLTNQIAAGEVIERPASVVKELVENAIDAQATKIMIRVKEGGISSIQVSDNGHGMEPEDAVLAFSRHATSKLKKERDLFSIRTLGFRGEALPSIASIAKVTLTTAHSADQLGCRVKFEGGTQQSVQEVSRSVGTDVLVEDLFYNTPARLKYLKTVHTEMAHIADIVGRIAMAHPEISFVLTHQNREVLRTPGDGKLKHVLHAIYGRQVASALLPIQGENFDFRIHGYLAKPEITRANRSYITLILNGRYIRSLPLTRAILRAFGTLLPVGRYPIVLLHIEMDPKLTDVNVHPTKLEVRLSKERECGQLIAEGVREALRGKVLIPKVDTQAKTKPKNKSIQTSFFFQNTANDRASKVKEERLPISPHQTQTVVEESHDQEAPTSRAPLDSEPDDSSDFPIQKEAEDSPEKEEISNPQTHLPIITPLAQIHGTYLVAQAEDGFYLIDQHAAHERVYYEQFYQKLGKRKHDQQLLVMPIPIECTLQEAKIIHQYLDSLQDWGMEIEPFGGETFLIRSYPNWFPEDQAQNLIFEIIDFLKEQGKVDTAVLRDATAKMLSCKAAIKANRHLRQDEMEHLIEQLKACDNPYTCPHGRPILVHFSTYELEKMFKRVM